jgi:hypothetical protein
VKRFQTTVAQIRDVEEAMKVVRFFFLFICTFSIIFKSSLYINISYHLHLQEHLILLGALVETQSRLATTMHESFKDGPFVDVSAQYVSIQQQTLAAHESLKAVKKQ